MSKYFDGEKLSGYEDSPITYVYGSNLEECHKVIADLEAKLAESENKFKASKDAIKFQSEEQKEWMDKYFNTAIKLEKLEQQLAEKEAEIEKLKDDYEQLEMQKDYYIGELRDELKETDQDKISFAVEQLEFLKNEIKMMGHIPNYTVLPERELICRFDVFRFIDNQIAELKKEMK